MVRGDRWEGRWCRRIDCVCLVAVGEARCLTLGPDASLSVGYGTWKVSGTWMSDHLHDHNDGRVDPVTESKKKRLGDDTQIPSLFEVTLSPQMVSDCVPRLSSHHPSAISRPSQATTPPTLPLLHALPNKALTHLPQPPNAPPPSPTLPPPSPAQTQSSPHQPSHPHAPPNSFPTPPH